MHIRKTLRSVAKWVWALKHVAKALGHTRNVPSLEGTRHQMLNKQVNGALTARVRARKHPALCTRMLKESTRHESVQGSAESNKRRPPTARSLTLTYSINKLASIIIPARRGQKRSPRLRRRRGRSHRSPAAPTEQTSKNNK